MIRLKGREKCACNAIAIAEVGSVHGKESGRGRTCELGKGGRLSQGLTARIQFRHRDAESDLLPVRVPAGAGHQKGDREPGQGQSVEKGAHGRHQTPVYMDPKQCLPVVILKAVDLWSLFLI